MATPVQSVELPGVGKKDRAPIPSYTPAQIKAIREKLNLTQADAAQLIGVGQSTWAQWESGDRIPSASSALLIKLLSEKKIK